MSNTPTRTRKNRKEDILQALATMLESEDGTNRITTAKLAKTVGLSEAALYRYFPSKAKMFDALIEYIEDAITVRINLILTEEKQMIVRLERIVQLLLGFTEKNPGLARIMTGHALMFEQDRLQIRLNQLFERVETQLRQVIRESKLREGTDFSGEERILASQILAFCEGLMVRFTRTGFRYPPSVDFKQRWALLIKQFI